MKSRTQYVCQQCGYKSPSYLGKCPNCSAWNSLVETVDEDRGGGPSWSKANKRERRGNGGSTNLREVVTTKVARIGTGNSEVDQVLGGGGIVPGSVILLAGEPGIGKSTLVLQLAAYIGGLYATGEESMEQVKLRGDRLKLPLEKILIFSETNIEEIIDEATRRIKEIKLLVVDSIQTLWSEELTGTPGAVGQVRESTLKLMEFAKSDHIPVILIGHVTKEGTIAGPKVLEHIVDTVLYLEGERYQSLRLLRATKNRFGPVDEVGVFSMEEGGMHQVSNPSEIFLGKARNQAGSTAIATLEGSRPILVEVQALCVATQIPIPRRIGTGINSNRLQMLIAILQRHLRLPLGTFDVFVNVASGIKVFEPAADLGICLAIVSSFKNKPLPPKTVVIGEVGLLGEIRPVIGLERRIKEARKLGFMHILSPKTHQYLSQLPKTLF